MTGKSTTWNFRTGFALLGAFSAALAVGWWLGYRTRSVEVDAGPFEVASGLPPGSVQNPAQGSAQNTAQDPLEKLRSENDDLMTFIDEVYALLNAEGIQIQLDVEVDPSGHLRMRAGSAKIKEELKAKLREINAP